MEAQLLVDPELLSAWSDEHHGGDIAALRLFADRAPLFVFAGDVGAGKTALAESFGCELSDALGVPGYLYRLKLTARGSGLVGEMTTLIGEAFAHLVSAGRKHLGRDGRSPTAISVLVVDEADAIAIRPQLPKNAPRSTVVANHGARPGIVRFQGNRR